MHSKNLEKIEAFITQHHVLTLATAREDEISACSLFYAYDTQSHSFIVASSFDTEHIQNVLKNANIAGNILLETSEIGKIEGLQFKGKMQSLEENRLKALYFKHFPYAVALIPKLWQIEVTIFKLTDNRLGFGKKLLWSQNPKEKEE